MTINWFSTEYRQRYQYYKYKEKGLKLKGVLSLQT